MHVKKSKQQLFSQHGLFLQLSKKKICVEV